MPDKIRDVLLESGIAVKPVYGPDDLQGIDAPGQPGEFPTGSRFEEIAGFLRARVGE